MPKPLEREILNTRISPEAFALFAKYQAVLAERLLRFGDWRKVSQSHAMEIMIRETCKRERITASKGEKVK